MAVVVRSRRLVNPSIRRTKKAIKNRFGASAVKKAGLFSKKKRKLSPKQVAIFGTPRQKAALKASRSRKRLNPSLKKLAGGGFNRKQRKAMVAHNKAGELHGLGKRTKAQYYGQQHIARKNKRKNIGEIVSISLAGLAGNPGKRRNSGMAKRRKARKATTHTTKRRRVTRRKNSGVVARRRRAATHRVVRRKRRSNGVYRVRRVHARRRNAGRATNALTGTLGSAIGVITGAVATRYLTQLALGGNNQGVVGYLGNALSAFALGWGLGKVPKLGKSFGTMVMIGGAVSLLLRVIQDQTSLGKYLNLSLSGAGKGGDTGIGIIQDSSFPLPQVMAPGSMTNAIVPRATRQYVASSMDAIRAKTAVAPGMGNVFGRRRVM